MITVHSISHSVAGAPLFNGITLSLSQKKYGLVGPNGVGKSSLARILVGEIAPDAGYVSRQGRCVYLAQQEERSAQTVAGYLQDIWENLGDEGGWVFSLLDALNLEQPLKNLSGGEWMRVRLSKVLSFQPDFLILDEPSNNLDRSGKRIIHTLLERFRGGILLISHDREFLKKMDTIIELSNQGIEVFGGNFEFYESQRIAERKRHADHLDRVKRESKKIEHESEEKRRSQEKRMRKGMKEFEKGGIPRILAGGLKRKAQVSLGKTVSEGRESVREAHNDIAKATGELKTDPFLRLDFKGAEVALGKTLVDVHRLQWTFTNSLESLWREPLSFTIRGPERWHIRGANGSGKSVFVKLVLGQLPESHGALEGTVRVNTSGIAYLDQGYGSLKSDISVIENIRESTRFTTEELRNELAFYGFTGEKVFQAVDTLSGGERLKASLAQMFLGLQIPELIVLDEPTNNLDLQGQGLLETALKKFRGALIVISHDEEFVRQLGVTQALTMSKGVV